MDDLQSFPTFQFSFFPKGKDGEQLVIRGNNLSQFVLDVEAIKSQFLGTTTSVTPTTPVTKKVCPTCGSEVIAGETKNGKKFEKCSTNKWDRDKGEAVGCSFIRWI